MLSDRHDDLWNEWIKVDKIGCMCLGMRLDGQWTTAVRILGNYGPNLALSKRDMPLRTCIALTSRYLRVTLVLGAESPLKSAVSAWRSRGVTLALAQLIVRGAAIDMAQKEKTQNGK